MRLQDPRSTSDAQGAARSLLLGDGPLAPTSEGWRQQFPEIIGRSPAMARVLETVSKVARSDSSVLVLGESGTGKELIAAAIHRLSARSHKPYVTINSSAIPETLLESEFFGHEKGAFTSADRRRIGRFEEAHGGTIFLDEIGDMPISLQAKLLRVLQDKRFTPLGGNEIKEADVRIVAATNKNLELAVKQKGFRLDLYYRLNVLPIVLPPLRERAGDVPDLLEHFVEKANREHNLRESSWLSDDVIRFLEGCQWPGNVRQLQNVVERLVVMKGGGVIQMTDLPRELIERIDSDAPLAMTASDSFEPLRSEGRGQILTLPRGGAMPPVRAPLEHGTEHLSVLPEEGLDLVRFIEDLENDLILQALARTGNNRNQAAKLLGLNRTTLVERIKKRRLCPMNEPSKEL